jgi:hypothetical protein
MEQLSFLSAIEPKRVEAAPASKLEMLAAGLKANRMGAIDREEFLAEQVRRLSAPVLRTPTPPTQ